MVRPLALALALALAGGPALAELDRVERAAEFVALVSGKTLTRPLVRLEVTTSGTIQGTGAKWAVRGRWAWREGYFCRDLWWGGDSLGYDCQEVRSDGQRIRFTSDRGRGASAVFRLRK